MGNQSGLEIITSESVFKYKQTSRHDIFELSKPDERECLLEGQVCVLIRQQLTAREKEKSAGISYFMFQ